MQMSQILTFVMPQPVAPYQSEVAPSSTQSNSTSVAFPTQRLIPLATRNILGVPLKAFSKMPLLPRLTNLTRSLLLAVLLLM
jgi:hypothetical protein